MIDWDLKLIILCSFLFFLGAYTIADWNKRKFVLILFLILLFSQAGFNYHLRVSDSVIPTSFAEIIFFSLLLIMGSAWLNHRKSFPKIGLGWPIRIYLIAALLGVLTAFYFNVSIVNIIIEAKSYVVYIFYLYLVPFLLKGKKEVTKCLWVLILFSIIPLVYILPNLKELSAMEYERVEIARYWGPLNIFSGYILPVVFIAISLYFITPGWIRKAYLLFFTILCLYTLFYSQTRGAWLSFSISSIIFALLSKKKIYLTFLLAVLVFLIFLTGSTEHLKSVVKHRILEETIDKQDTSLQDRLNRWEIAKSIFKAYPLTGSGWGGYLKPLKDGQVSAVSSLGLPTWHNSFLEILSQLGIFGIIAFYWIWYRILKLSYIAWRESNDSKERLILAGMLSAVLSIFIYSLGEQQFYRIETASVSWFIIGLLVFYSKDGHNIEERPIFRDTHLN